MATITGRIIDRNGGAAAGLQVEAWARPSTRAHQSNLAAGMHQHSFEGAADPLKISSGEVLVAYVYLDPVDPPREVMLQWNHNGWEHRAYWGDNLIDLGTSGTESRQFMGPLPPVGQWERLEVPAGLAGLEGRAIHGIAFTLFDGRATWDHAGKAFQPGLTPAEDVDWVEDVLPEGATSFGDGEGWAWITADPLPFSASGADQLANTITQSDGRFYLDVADAVLADRFQDRPAMVYFRVLQENAVLASTENTVVWRADSPSDVEIEVEVPPIVPQPSEYERLHRLVDPLIGEQELAELTREEVRQFAESHGIVAAHLIDLWGAVRLSGEADLPVELFYGLLRRDLPRDLDRLLLRALDDIGAALEAAVAQNIIPAQLRDSLPDLMRRLGRLKTEHTPVAELVEMSQVPLPPELEAFLADKRIRTLADARAAGPISRLEGLPVAADDPAVKALEAQAQLTLLGIDPGTSARLIENGYMSLHQVATAPADSFLGALVPEVGTVEADRLRGVALAQSLVLNSQTMRLATGYANGYFEAESGTVKLDPDLIVTQKCGCEDCASAVSPAAYLADLMGFATTKLGMAQKGVMPLYRLFNPSIQAKGGHFYTSEQAEREAMIGKGYRDEGIACFVFATQSMGTFPFYRLVNGAGHYFYTTSTNESDNAVRNHGFKRNGDVGFVYDFKRKGTVPLYRLWHETGDRLYTTDPTEAKIAKERHGYREETGVPIACYVPGTGHDRLQPHQLSEHFHQPFSELPLDCSQVDTQVRQARICVEVLRSYLRKLPAGGGGGDAHTLAEFKQRQRAYLGDAYQRLLLKMGTSYAELRELRGSDQVQRRELAARLGIPATAVLTDLGQWLLDPEKLSESDLERVFGLADTTQDPLSEGVKEGDTLGQVRRWRFQGVRWGANTDADGKVYPGLKRADMKFTVEIYRDAQRKQLVARGETPGDDWPAALSPVQHSQLSGEISIHYQQDAADCAVRVVPLLLCWRMQALRELWQRQDWSSDAYSYDATIPAAEWRPVVDPDVIGPDDFRNPIVNSDPFFTLWAERRKWVDDLLSTLRSLRTNVALGDGSSIESPTFALLFEAMERTELGIRKKQLWGANAESALAQLHQDLTQKSSMEVVRKAIENLWKKFKLLPEQLKRLQELQQRFAGWSYDPSRNQPLQVEEWEEVYSILTQAHKAAWFEEWIKEEQAIATADGEPRPRLGPHHFWAALREPQEGSWPPAALPEGMPWIDPETTKPEALPDETAGAKALEVHHDRKAELETYRAGLVAMSKDKSGFAKRIDNALAVSKMDDLREKLSELDGSDPSKAEAARKYIEGTLRLTVENFRRIMAVWSRLNPNSGETPSKPTTAEWAELERLLTTAYKERTLLKKWAEEEQTQDLKYWRLLKMRLPRWRCSSEARRAWQQALTARSASPLIDPDLLREGHFQPDRAEARKLKREREDQVARLSQGWSVATDRAGLESRLVAVLGPLSSAALQKLITEARDGNLSTERLEQLSLERDAAQFLARMHGLLSQNPPEALTEREWTAIGSILAQVWKRRCRADWQEDEKKAGITLSPDWFKFPAVDQTQFPPLRPPAPPEWRGTRVDVQDWEDRLQARIDQETTIVSGLRQAVDEVEEATLPSLRDALILFSNAPGTTLQGKAEWLAQTLLINMQQSGCQKTTRVAQAIETLQKLLWCVRTGLLNDTRPELQLIPSRLDSDQAILDFDEAWKWIGSYATWRAAMFVFLYPENILVPSLRRHQTPAFKKLVADLRSRRRLSPEQARQFAAQYAEYFQDVCTLELKACLTTTTRAYGEDEPIHDRDHQAQFLFGLSTASNRLYWCLQDLETRDIAYAQTFWRHLEGARFKNEEILRVVGATAHNTLGKKRYIYLFVQTEQEGEQKLWYIKYNRDTGEWDSEGKPIKLDKEISQFTVLLKITQETELPMLRVTYELTPSTGGIQQKSFLLQLNRKEGGEEDIRVIGDTQGWSGVHQVEGDLVYTVSGSKSSIADDWFGIPTAGGGVAVLHKGYEGSLVFFHVHDRKGSQNSEGYFRIGQKLQADGRFESWSNVVPIPGWFGAATVGGGAAVADIKGNGNQDLLVFHVDNPQGPDKGYYRIGWNLQENGTVDDGWYGPKDTGLQFGYDTRASDIAIARIGADLFLYVLWVDQAAGGDKVYYRRIRIQSNGGLDRWSNRFIGPPIPAIVAAAGIALEDVNQDGKPEIVFFYVQDNEQGNKGYYQIGWGIDSEGKATTWSQTFEVGGQDGWFGNDTAGGSVAVVDVNRNGVADLVIFHIDIRPGGNTGHYRVGWDFGDRSFPVAAPCSVTNIKPTFAGPYQITDGPNLGRHRQAADLAFRDNKPARPANLTYLEEAFYFVPVHIALQLQRCGQYKAALDWLRLVFDYTHPVNGRTLAGLAPQVISREFQRDEPNLIGDEYDWLLDPLNPHSIARTRDKTYLRSTVLSIVRCLLDYGDAEFTIDSPETTPLARELYDAALGLLDSPELKQTHKGCEDMIADITIRFGERWQEHIPELLPPNLDRKDLAGWIGRMQAILDRTQDVKEIVDRGLELLDGVRGSGGRFSNIDTIINRRDTGMPIVHASLLADPHIRTRIEGVAINSYHGSGPGRGPSPTAGPASPALPVSVRTLVAAPRASAGQPTSIFDDIKFEVDNGLGASQGKSGWWSVSHGFCVPRNPILYMLRLRAHLNKYKIDNCRNIDGMKRVQELYAAPTDTQTGLPSIGAGGQLVLPGAARYAPTPYRYQTLIERAKHLAQLAMQIESAFLLALEKRDAEAYTMLKATQDLRLARANVRLRELRVAEAQSKITLVNLQSDRTAIQAKHYTRWLSAGLNEREWDMIRGYYGSLGAQVISIWFGGVIEASKVGKELTNAVAVRALSDVAAAAIQTTIQINSIWASQERRMDEWRLGKELAEQDMRIGDQEIDLAEDGLRVVEQEHAIAEMESDNATEVVEFLSNKFTSQDLYDWMIGILEGVYGYFLEQATAIARQAQDQLAFERQETPPAYILADYWEAPADESSPNLAGQAPDRRGLTGSARLLQDIYQLDQYAFEKNKRKQNLTKTISLAQLDPLAFERFRESGVLPFTTPMELFDRDFPGHYLRLIKRVRTSVIALIPPSQGIRATLSSLGLSRVVIGGDTFQRITLRRDPETVTLSSPVNDSGSFELEAQTSSEMLLPFEGMGVDAQWEFRMPHAANRIDYSSIADILMTVEYTALDSPDYREQVLQLPALNRPLSVDRLFSFHREFADAWYDLHNPELTATPMSVWFETQRQDFPPNTSDLKIQHVALYFAPTGKSPVSIDEITLRFLDNQRPPSTGSGDQVSVSVEDGLVSTRRSNASPWSSMIGKSPVGWWQLTLPQSATALFGNDSLKPRESRVADILLILTVTGRLPDWPQ